MKKVLIALSLLCLLVVPAQAFRKGTSFTVIHNFQSSTSDSTTKITHHADNGDALDAHAGNLLQVGSKFYLYGETHACGFHPGTVGGPSCGIAAYSSTDLSTWHFEGFLFDMAAGSWPSRCTSANGNSNYTGCYSPKMMYNAKNNNYVLWIFVAGATTNDNFFAVLTCTSPTGGATPTVPGSGCTQQANGTFPATASEAPGFYVEPGNLVAYAVYTDLTALSYAINVIALNSDFTNTTGLATNTGAAGEGVGIFERGGITYVIYGSTACAYCANATVRYVSAASPLGSYGASVLLNSNSCLGQTRDAAVIINGGMSSYIYTSDQWWAQVAGTRGNQGFATVYFENLKFSGTSILPFNCSQNTVVPGIFKGPAPVYPGGTPDQTDFGDVFGDWCDITPTTPRFQTFIPTTTILNKVALPLGKNNASCAAGTPGCTNPDGSLTVSIKAVDGSHKPTGAALASSSIAASALSWATKRTEVSFGLSVSVGTEYAIQLSGSNTIGCFGAALSQAGPVPYPSGVSGHSADSGSTWLVDQGSLMFSTY